MHSVGQRLPVSLLHSVGQRRVVLDSSQLHSVGQHGTNILLDSMGHRGAVPRGSRQAPRWIAPPTPRRTPRPCCHHHSFPPPISAHSSPQRTLLSPTSAPVPTTVPLSMSRSMRLARMPPFDHTHTPSSCRCARRDRMSPHAVRRASPLDRMRAYPLDAVLRWYLAHILRTRTREGFWNLQEHE